MAQDETQQGSPDPSAMIDFARDIQPIFEEKCLKCHGPDDAKNDFRIDQLDSVSSYVEAGDLESSSMWTDYLLTDDSDMLMPPATADTRGGLAGGQLAVIKLWIEEGAKWDWQTQASASDATDSVEAPADPGTASLPARVWTFQGLFHPASVHFPLALVDGFRAVCVVVVFQSRILRTGGISLLVDRRIGSHRCEHHGLVLRGA